ncbi:MAG: sugar transport periplasmic component [Rhizobium sp.]|nr:sugar transport periplasmic component [Rhizobium sp.]
MIAEAKSKSIPVVAFNIDADRTASGNLSYIAQDLRAAGATLGRRARGSIGKGSKVIITVHDEGVWALEERMAGMKAALMNQDIEWKVVCTGQKPVEGAERLHKALENFSATALLGTGNGDTEACGIVAKRMAGSAPYVGGFDLSPGIVELIDEGFIDCSIDQQPYAQGFYPVVQLALYLRYGLMPSSLDAGAAVIDRSNVHAVRELSRRSIR